MRTLLVIALIGCGHSKPKTVTPLPVAIVTPVQISWEGPEKPDCYIEPMPDPPDEATTMVDEDDVIRRVFVHIRQFNELVAWAHDVTIWARSVDECLEQLRK